MEITSEKIPFCKKGRKIGSGVSNEYKIGSDLFDLLLVGQSTKFGLDVSRDKILIRLKRICVERKSENEYTTTLIESELENEKGYSGFYVLRTK